MIPSRSSVTIQLLHLQQQETSNTTMTMINLVSCTKLMNVMTTGFQEGDTLIGVGPQNKDVIIRVHGASSKPFKAFVTGISKNSQQHTEYLTKLNMFPMYESLSIAEKKEAISGPSTNKYLHQHANIGIEVLSIPEECKAVAKLDDDRKNTFEDLIQSTMIVPAGDIFVIFRDQQNDDISPRAMDRLTKVNDVAMMNKMHWKINTTYSLKQSYNGIIIDSSTGEQHEGMDDLSKVTNEGSTTPGIYVFKTPNLPDFGIHTIQCADRTKQWSVDEGYNHLSHVMGDKVMTKDMYDIVNINLSIYGAMGLESLLQKTIRYNAKSIELTYTYRTVEDNNSGCITSVRIVTTAPEKIYVDGVEFCIIVWWRLLLSQGYFNASIQRFISGKELSFKRLASTIAEDGHHHCEYDMNMLTSLAYVSKLVCEYKPDIDTIYKCMLIIIDVYHSAKAFDTEDRDTYNVSNNYMSFDLSVRNMSTIFITLCDSMKKEIQVFMSMDANDGIYCDLETNEQPEIMEIEHGIDHNSDPSFVYYVDLEWFRKHASQTSPKIASKVFEILDTKISSINWRRYDSPIDFNDEDVNVLRLGRCKFARSKYLLYNRSLLTAVPEIVRERDHVMIDYEHTLEDSWLAGMVGTIYNREDEWMATLRPDNLSSTIIVKIPKRDTTDLDMSESDKLIAQQAINTRFSDGIKIASPPCTWMEGGKVKVVNDEYIIYNNDEESFWEDAKEVRIKYKSLKRGFKPLNSYHFTVQYEEGIVDEPDFSVLRSMYSEFELARALAFLYTDFTEIKVPVVSRDGGGTKTALTVFDVGAFQVLHQLAYMYPGVLVARSITSLKVRNPVGLIMLRSILGRELDKSRDNKSDVIQWPTITDVKKRTLFPHQTKAIDSLKSNFSNGKKGSFVWLTLGSGKSLIVLSFIKWLRENNKLPSRVLYTLPAGALTSLANEIYMMGFEIVLLSPVGRTANSIKVSKPDGTTHIVKSVKTMKQTKPFTLVLIEHDHLKKVSDELMSYMSDTMFVIDEVHKGLGATLRTSALLNCALLSYHFVAMTGTPTVDGNTCNLIPWLRMISDYPVTQRNHLVAINSMISDSVNVGKRVEDKEIVLDIPEEMKEDYMKILPVNYGGSHIGPITRPILMSVLEYCYNVCDLKMVEDAKEYIESKGRGVFIVTKDKEHQQKMYDMCSKAINVPIFLITSKQSLNMTDETVKSGAVDYKIVITTKNLSEGYTLTRLSVMLHSVYFSNEASRSQMKGRINRIGQNNESVVYQLYISGMLSEFNARHQGAKNLASILAKMVD